MAKIKPRARSAEQLHPALRADGTLDLQKLFKETPKQLELLVEEVLNGVSYTTLRAPQCLSVGGARSGKTQGALWFGITNYVMKFNGCDILVLRRTFKELENGAIADLKAIIPENLGLYTYDATRHIATFTNGSRIVFGHCADNKERTINQYLGQAYPFILVDECAQFSIEAWQLLKSRNAVNANCQPDEHGNWPKSCMWGCTNPLGSFWAAYHTMFVKQEPVEKPEGAKEDLNGNWFVQENGEWICVHNTADFSYNHSTVFDNPIFVAKNPDYVATLRAMPKAMRDKYLHGLLDSVEGQYFDVWSDEYHVVNLRDDAEAILWQPWQPVWAGEDWGMGSANSGSANATYLFTRAMVRSPLTNEYKLKTVCFDELLVTGGKTYKELADLISRKCKLPDGTPVKLKAIYFSHEKFARVMDEHTPAEEYSKELRSKGCPGVTRGTKDRVSSASFMYSEFKSGNVVILDTCKEIINTIPRLLRDPNDLNDVLKVRNKGDDAYDAFRLGLYGQLGAKRRPEEDTIKEHANTLSPLERFFYLQMQEKKLAEKNSVFAETKTDSHEWVT